MWGYNGQDWWWMVPMMLLFWGAVIAIVFLVARARTTTSRGGDKAVETLRARLASGAINQDEYDKTNRTLQG